MAVRFTAAEKQQLERLCAVECRDISKQIRFMVREYLRNNPVDSAIALEGTEQA